MPWGVGIPIRAWTSQLEGFSPPTIIDCVFALIPSDERVEDSYPPLCGLLDLIQEYYTGCYVWEIQRWQLDSVVGA